MAIPIDEVRRMAELSRIRFSDEAMNRMARELETILAYIRKLDELDTTHVEPMSHVHEYEAVVREDVVTERLTRDAALEGAPDTDGEYFYVPKVIE